jgi:hypothetical protein
MNPFDLVFNALWKMVDDSLPLQSLVLAGNKIRYNKAEDRNPLKPNVAASDLPEILLLTEGITAPNIHATSCSTRLTKEYAFVISTGDIRVTLLHPVEWAFLCALQDWSKNLAVLKWNNESFVLKCDLLSTAEGLSNKDANRGIHGWASIWRCAVQMNFSQAMLREYNNTIPTPLVKG